MKAVFLSLSILCFFLMDQSVSFARDVQLRTRADDEVTPLLGRSRVASAEETSKLTTEERLKRLERILESQGLVDMLVRIENMQSELQILRGEIELHTHELGEIKQRQRDLYVDIDRRLLQLERNAPQGGASATPSAGTEVTTPSTATVTPSPSSAAVATSGAGNATPASSSKQASFADEQKAYQKAFDLLRDLRYDQAVKAFREFIQQFPAGRYAHIAQYWIGEANYAQRNFKAAIQDYQQLIDRYPNSPKLAEAMLKIGYSEYELKQYERAESILGQLVKNYPGTTEAGQAQNLLQKIRLKR